MQSPGKLLTSQPSPTLESLRKPMEEETRKQQHIRQVIPPPQKKKQNKPPKEIRRKERKENQTTTSTAVHVSGNPAICVRKKTRSYADMRSTLIDVDASFLLDHRQTLRRRRSKLNQSAVLVSEVGFYRRQHSERKLSGLEGQATRPVQFVLHRTSTHCLRVLEV